MKVQLRCGVFETNSSSVHTLTICKQSELDEWVKGVLILDVYCDELVPFDNLSDEDKENLNDGYCEQYQTYDQFFNNCEFETYSNHYSTEHGDEIFIFGYYGHD